MVGEGDADLGVVVAEEGEGGKDAAGGGEWVCAGPVELAAAELFAVGGLEEGLGADCGGVFVGAGGAGGETVAGGGDGDEEACAGLAGAE